ncbi:MAG: hypothetical protein MUO21_07710 [Nitrososphaeraceae archaeon]|nr:hypothetical protein [Nitrososphaeraceae archaeon]
MDRKESGNSWMKIFRMVLLFALLVLLLVLVKNYFFPATKEVSIKGGLFSPTELNMSALKFE